MADCNHDCSNCSANCSSREGGIAKEAPHELSKIKKVIGVVSGKGGVGKSLVTSMMAVTSRRLGYETAVLDADITGPSIGQTFGVHGRAQGNGMGILPMFSKTGIKLMSVNFMLAEETDPVVWRGSMIANAVKQFWTDVIWDDVDFMFIDMPPGTGDVPLTVFQSLPLDGIVVVTSPQELVSMIVSKAMKMADMMNIPVLGVVENMSYFECKECKTQHKIFGESHIDEIAQEFGTRVLAKVPMDDSLAKCVDTGSIELFVGNYFEEATNIIEDELSVK